MFGTGTARRNVGQLLQLLAMLLVLILVYSVAFHYLMEYEGRGGDFSWFTGFYWTLTVMSTLGYGDITFHSDLGRAFSTLVLITGLTSLLVIFPFTFIQFFWAPWLEAQREAQAPRKLPADTRGHVIVTSYEPVSQALLRTLAGHAVHYVLIVPTVNEALRLRDEGYEVMVGQPDNPETYELARVENAALVAATGDDEWNTNIAFTVREVSATVPIVTIASRAASVDILELAGSDHVLLLGDLLGAALARRADSSDTALLEIGRFGELVVAEVPVSHTALAKRPVAKSMLRERYGVTIAGFWDRGRFHPPRAETQPEETAVAILVGTEEQMQTLNTELMRNLTVCALGPVLVIGGGRIGRAVANTLEERGVQFRVVERDAGLCPANDDRYVVGDAAELEVLEHAGLLHAPTVIITTQDDDTNIYLTIYCRRLRPDIQIIGRATHQRNVDTLHRAGADFVMSYASLGAGTILNLLSRRDLLMVAEGLNLIRIVVPSELVGKTIADSELRPRTGCSIVAIIEEERTISSPSPDTILKAGAELVLIGTVEAEQQLFDCFGEP